MRLRAMNGALLVAILAAVMLNSIHVTRAESTSNIPRIGFLTNTFADGLSIQAFRQALQELCYVEGKNVVIEQGHADWKSERLPELAEELVRLRVDIIVCEGAGAAVDAQRATRTIPIVMGGDPVAAGLVGSLARPGGNVTGVSTQSTDLARSAWNCSGKSARAFPLSLSCWVRTPE